MAQPQGFRSITNKPPRHIFIPGLHTSPVHGCPVNRNINIEVGRKRICLITKGVPRPASSRLYQPNIKPNIVHFNHIFNLDEKSQPINIPTNVQPIKPTPSTTYMVLGDLHVSNNKIPNKPDIKPRGE